jgi:nitroreductase
VIRGECQNEKSRQAIVHTKTELIRMVDFKSTAIGRLKLRLQFTGWLQYLPNALFTFFFLLVAAISGAMGGWSTLLFRLLLGIGALTLVVLIFDVMTVKFGFRPNEALPKRKDDVEAFDRLRGRRSCRSFQTRKLIPAHHAELMESVRIHSHPNQQLGTRPIRFEYTAAPLTVWPVVGCREFLVAIAPHEYDRVAVIDVGRSLQKVVIDATRMGLATCWIGPGADQKSIAKELGDRFNPVEDHIICVCAVGYKSFFKPTFLRIIQMAQRNRLPLSSLFFSTPDFEEPLDVTAKPFDSYGGCYEVCQWSPSSFNAQTTRCAAVVAQVDGEAKLTRFDFAAATSSRYYAAVALGIWCGNWEVGCRELGKEGSFVWLTPEERGAAGPELPRYDVSWVLKH